jgi:hypothetical protein
LHHVLRLVVLTAATLGSSWAAYQSARWNGVQSRQLSRASAQRSESVRASNRAMQLAQIDVTAFAAWALAVGEGNQIAATFLRERFRTEFQPAFQAWLASAGRPRTIPAGTPFQRSEYRPTADAEAARLLDDAERAAAAGQRANQLSDNYMFTIVMFSTVVFLAGVDRPDQPARRTRFILGALPVALLIFALAFMLRLPVTIGF